MKHYSPASAIWLGLALGVMFAMLWLTAGRI
jgi:hypothetical protein